MKNRSLFIILIGIIFSSIVGCKKTTIDSEKILLAVSIEPQRKMLEEIAGPQYEIITMLGKGSNPETYEPTVSQKMKASKAKAYFSVGYLPFEQIITKDLPEDVCIVNTSEKIKPITGTHSHGGDVHQEPDPHVWSSFKNAKAMAESMTKKLCEINSDSIEKYQQRYSIMINRLDSLDKTVSNLLIENNCHAFAVWHPSLSYFANDYGLHQLSVGQESKEASISNIAEIIQEAQKDSVKVFFYQKEFDSRQAENISKEIGAILIPISPLEYDWENELMNITNVLVKH